MIIDYEIDGNMLEELFEDMVVKGYALFFFFGYIGSLETNEENNNLMLLFNFSFILLPHILIEYS